MPYVADSGNVLLVTSPSAVFNKHKNTPPENFIEVGQSELTTLERVTKSIGFLDMDLPIEPSDISAGLMDEKGAKVKLAVLGRGVFSSGKHHFKPAVFWSDPNLGKAMERFVETGGVLFIGPSYPNREILPDWLLTWTRGGWEEGTLSDHVVAANIAPSSAKQKLVDELSVDDPTSEKDHAVTFEGATFEETQKLPDGDSEGQLIEDKGRGFKGYYQFTLKTVPGQDHRLWFRVNTGHNLIGTTLQIWSGDKWVQLGIRTQNDSTTRHFQSLYFEVPAKDVTADHTQFRLVSKYGDEVNVYHLRIDRLDREESKTLPEVLGLSAGAEAGMVGHGLIPKSSEWKSPLVLAQHPDQAALIILKRGQGYLVRSELSLEDSVKLFKAFLDPATLDELGQSWN